MDWQPSELEVKLQRGLADKHYLPYYPKRMYDWLYPESPRWIAQDLCLVYADFLEGQGAIRLAQYIRECIGRTTPDSTPLESDPWFSLGDSIFRESCALAHTADRVADTLADRGLSASNPCPAEPWPLTGLSSVFIGGLLTAVGRSARIDPGSASFSGGGQRDAEDDSRCLLSPTTFNFPFLRILPVLDVFASDLDKTKIPSLGFVRRIRMTGGTHLSSSRPRNHPDPRNAPFNPYKRDDFHNVWYLWDDRSTRGYAGHLDFAGVTSFGSLEDLQYRLLFPATVKDTLDVLFDWKGLRNFPAVRAVTIKTDGVSPGPGVVADIRRASEALLSSSGWPSLSRVSVELGDGKSIETPPSRADLAK